MTVLLHAPTATNFRKWTLIAMGLFVRKSLSAHAYRYPDWLWAYPCEAVSDFFSGSCDSGIIGSFLESEEHYLLKY